MIKLRLTEGSDVDDTREDDNPHIVPHDMASIDLRTDEVVYLLLEHHSAYHIRVCEEIQHDRCRRAHSLVPHCRILC